MRVLIATDAWHPQVNGVVHTITHLVAELRLRGIGVDLLAPQRFVRVPLPGYGHLGVALPRAAVVAQAISEASPDFIHIATEGPIGWAVRRYCLRRGRPFTTSYHTKFPEYARSIYGLPESWIYAVTRRFHDRSAGVMVATASLEADLSRRGYSRLMRWSRGVDTELFKPSTCKSRRSQPAFLFVGRISREKNIEAFLEADLPGERVVVGDGPRLAALRRRYGGTTFLGSKSGRDLAAVYAAADVFVFPSRTDTFGLVLLEAMASGLPVAAYPVTGPIDIVEHGVSGALDEDLAKAARMALTLSPGDARARSEQFSWSRSADQFLANIQQANAAAVSARSRASADSRHLITKKLEQNRIGTYT